VPLDLVVPETEDEAFLLSKPPVPVDRDPARLGDFGIPGASEEKAG
jgi:hypothetical protein